MVEKKSKSIDDILKERDLVLYAGANQRTPIGQLAATDYYINSRMPGVETRYDLRKYIFENPDLEKVSDVIGRDSEQALTELSNFTVNEFLSQAVVPYYKGYMSGRVIETFGNTKLKDLLEAGFKYTSAIRVLENAKMLPKEQIDKAVKIIDANDYAAKAGSYLFETLSKPRFQEKFSKQYELELIKMAGENLDNYKPAEEK